MVLDPGSLLVWIVAGLIAGFIAGQFMRGGGYGIVGDVSLGIIGALVGGFLASLLGIGGLSGFWVTVVGALLGAAGEIAVVRAVAPSRTGF